MSSLKPIKIKGRRVVLTEKMIDSAQKDTKSNMEAARWLGVSYNTYKKWAKYYGLFDRHLNQEGFGIKKGWASYKINLDDILSKKVELPKRYSQAVIKKRLIEDGYFQNECSMCSYNEFNIVTNEICLKLDFKDGDSRNFSLDNLQLLCPNCYLSVNGFFHKSKYFCK